METSFPDIQSATSAILVDVNRLLEQKSIQYVFVGGWCPLLRGGNQDIHHPGTHDVDVLFGGTRDEMICAVRSMLDGGYLVSAKHEFQLLKQVRVKDRNFVFNVDLLHPNEQEKDFGLFSDIMDLGIREVSHLPKTRHIKSIAFPSANIVFSQTLWSPFELKARSLAGDLATIKIPLLDECGLVISKGVSVKAPKRTRDAFDIYFVLSGMQGDDIAKRIRNLYETDSSARIPLESLKEFLSEDQFIFDRNVSYFAPRNGAASAAEFVRNLLFPS